MHDKDTPTHDMFRSWSPLDVRHNTQAFSFGRPPPSNTHTCASINEDGAVTRPVASTAHQAKSAWQLVDCFPTHLPFLPCGQRVFGAPCMDPLELWLSHGKHGTMAPTEPLTEPDKRLMECKGPAHLCAAGSFPRLSHTSKRIIGHLEECSTLLEFQTFEPRLLLTELFSISQVWERCPNRWDGSSCSDKDLSGDTTVSATEHWSWHFLCFTDLFTGVHARKGGYRKTNTASCGFILVLTPLYSFGKGAAKPWAPWIMEAVLIW